MKKTHTQTQKENYRKSCLSWKTRKSLSKLKVNMKIKIVESVWSNISSKINHNLRKTKIYKCVSVRVWEHIYIHICSNKCMCVKSYKNNGNNTLKVEENYYNNAGEQYKYDM